MFEKIDLLIAVLLGADTVVAFLCGIVLYRGGFIAFSQEIKPPSRVQLMFSLSLFFSAPLMAVELINNYFMDAPSMRVILIDAGLSPLSWSMVLLAGWTLQQRELTRWHWLVAFCPYMPLLILSFITPIDDLTLFKVVDYLTYFYLAGTFFYSIYILREWDKTIEDHYSDIAHKQTLWFRNLLLPYLMILLLWLLIDLFPEHQKWLLVVNHLLMMVILVSTTSHALAQEVFFISETEPDLPAHHTDIIHEAKDSSNSIPQWGAKLERIMAEQKPYLKEDLTCAELASMIGINRTYLSRYLNDMQHVTFYEYINSHRLQETEQLLQEEALSMEEIALKSGFRDRQALYRTFTKYRHISPSEWRQKSLQTKNTP